MSDGDFAAQLAQDLDAADLRLVVEVFVEDVGRLLGVLDGAVARGDAAAARRTCHSLAGAAGAVGAVALERACRDAMGRTDLGAAGLATVRAELRALGATAHAAASRCLAGLRGG